MSSNAFLGDCQHYPNRASADSCKNTNVTRYVRQSDNRRGVDGRKAKLKHAPRRVKGICKWLIGDIYRCVTPVRCPASRRPGRDSGEGHSDSLAQTRKHFQPWIAVGLKPHLALEGRDRTHRVGPDPAIGPAGWKPGGA